MKDTYTIEEAKAYLREVVMEESKKLEHHLRSKREKKIFMKVF